MNYFKYTLKKESDNFILQRNGIDLCCPFNAVGHCGSLCPHFTLIYFNNPAPSINGIYAGIGCISGCGGTNEMEIENPEILEIKK